MPDTDEKIEIESITSPDRAGPGRAERVSRAKYMAMRDAFLLFLNKH